MRSPNSAIGPSGSHVSICHSWTDTYGRGSTGVKRRAEQYSGTVQASHLLVKHRDSRRPSSHKEKVVTRSKVHTRFRPGYRVQAPSIHVRSGYMRKQLGSRRLRHCWCLVPAWALIGSFARHETHSESVALQAEALQLIQGFREQIVSGQTDFATLAKAESHCSSATRGGDLGEFGPGQMQKSFEDVRASLAMLTMLSCCAPCPDACRAQWMRALVSWR